MPANVFHFKQFSIYQDRCAFKVGTDGILLGAWAGETPALNAVEAAIFRALDIGTGTGLIALMLAQRFPKAVIDAIEIDEQSASQAIENVTQSLWADRVCIHNSAIQDFPKHNHPRYDLIVSNPPFFSTARNLSAAGQREGTRQTTQLSHEDLLHTVNRLLGENGRFCTILPTATTQQFCQLAALNNLY
ncbi:MAG: methyltransferase domain-containing protein, partial [Chloroflexi bacterium]